MPIVNLQAPTVAVREIRLSTITGYEGNASNLLRQSCSGGLGERSRGFSQCLGCSTSNAACMTVLVQDGAVISHGPVGCSTCLHEFAFTYRVNAPVRGVEKVTPRHVYSTNLSEDETVFGGGEKLAATISEVFERDHPAVIFVITTCASGIIGDDVEGIADAAQAELGIPVVAIFCEGFRSKVWTSGFDAAYHGIARKLVQPARPPQERGGTQLPSGTELPSGTDAPPNPESRPPQERPAKPFINVINFWGSDIFSPFFERFGAEARYITPYSTLETLRTSSEAVASIQICTTLGSYLTSALEQAFGVPALRAAPPYGVAATDRWLRALGELLGQPEVAEELIAEGHAEYLPQIAELREQLSGRSAYVTAGAGHGHAMLQILGELGIEATGAALFHHDPINDIDSEDNDSLVARVRDYGDVPNFSICNKQEFELVNVLNRIRPDLLFARHGGMTLWGAKLGIPSLLIGDEQWGMGYQGVVRYGKAVLEVLENDEFVTNLAKHAINPYSKWWLSQSPYSFLEVE